MSELSIELSLLSIVTVHQVSGVIFPVNQTTLNRFASPGTKKMWHNYIKKYLEVILCRKHVTSKRNYSEGKGLPQIFAFLESYTKLFTQAKYETGGHVQRYQSKWCKHDIMQPGCEYMNTTRLTGVLPTLFGDIHKYPCPNDKCMRHICHQEIYQSLHFEFKLNRILRLNLTIIHLHSQSQDCMFNVQVITGTRSRHTFCGRHPQVSVFPTPNNVLVRKIFPLFTFAKSDMHYTVIDSQTVSFATHQKTKYRETGIIYYFNRRKVFVHFYHVRVEHYKIIILRLTNGSNDSVEIHDGPSLKSEILKNVFFLRNFESSSFQVVLSLSSTQRVIFNVDTSLKYFSIQSSQCFHVFISMERKLSMSVAFGVCKNHYQCTVHLETNRESVFKISLSELNYEGDKQVADCSYAGLALYDTHENSHQYMHSECVKQAVGERYHLDWIKGAQSGPTYARVQNISTLKYTSPSVKHIYSVNNEFMLVFFCYKEHGSLNLSVSAKATNCRVQTLTGISNYKVVLSWTEPCFAVQVLKHPNQHGVRLHGVQITMAAYAQSTKKMTLSAAGFLKGDTFKCCFFLSNSLEEHSGEDRAGFRKYCRFVCRLRGRKA